MKAAVRKRLKHIGAYQHWPVQMGMGEACLDCHGCISGHYFAIETKRPGGKLTLRQQNTIKKIEAAGGAVYVIDSVEKASVLFDNLKSNGASFSPVQPQIRDIDSRAY